MVLREQIDYIFLGNFIDRYEANPGHPRSAKAAGVYQALQQMSEEIHLVPADDFRFGGNVRIRRVIEPDAR